MKRHLTIAFMLATIFSVYAQWYVGGEMGYWRDYDDNTTSFVINPEAGYNFNAKWSAGAVMGYRHTYDNGEKQSLLVFKPNVKYKYLRSGKVTCYLAGVMEIGHANLTEASGRHSTAIPFSLGVKPGFGYLLDSHLALVANVGYLGFAKSNGIKGFRNRVGIDFSAYNLTIGLYYNF